MNTKELLKEDSNLTQARISACIVFEQVTACDSQVSFCNGCGHPIGIFWRVKGTKTANICKITTKASKNSKSKV